MFMIDWGWITSSWLLAVLDASPETPVTRYQIEAAADGLAELIKQGNRLEGAYTFDKGQLKSGFPE
jgi:hypothetical protein